MEKKNLLLQLSFVIVVFLALGLTFMRMSGTDTGADSLFSSRKNEEAYTGRFVPPEVARRTVESLKNEELLGISPAETAEGLGFAPEHKRAQAVRRYGREGNAFGSAENYSAGQTGRLPSGGGTSYGGGSVSRNAASHLPSSERYGGREGSAGYSSSVSRTRGGGVSSRSNAYAGRGQNNVRGQNNARGGFAGVARPTPEESSARTFAPYLTSLTPEAAASLKRQLTGLSSRVERAVLQAMLPKSRKDANIEKYLQRNSAYSASSGPFASVANQMNAQKAGIMNSMSGAFGKEAVDEAGKVMDAYQKELLGALSQKGLTQEQAAQKTRDISQKYEKELQNVGQKHALKDFREQREAKDNTLQSQLAQAYGADIAAQADSILASWREKDMQLALAGLPEEEYYKQQLENQFAQRKELEEMILKNGLSLKPLQDNEDERERTRIADRRQAIAEGKELPTEHHYSKEQINDILGRVAKERRKNETIAAQDYGEEGLAAVQAIYNRHEARMREILQSDLPLVDKEEQLMLLRQEETNAQLEALQKSPEMRQAREKEQVNSTMEQLMKDPGVANASPEEKAAFERLARPVLQDMFQRINAVSESDLPADEKKRRIAALQERAQRQLSGQ